MKGYRTVAFNVIMGVIMLVRAIAPDAELPGEEAVGSAVDLLDAGLSAGWALGNIVLRAITTSAIFTKQ